MAGNGLGDDDLTPSDFPDSTLPMNRQYSIALRGSLLAIEDAKKTLTALLHKVRMTREPIDRGPDLGDEIRDAYAAIEAIGRTGKSVVSKARGIE
jgi:hypothetical protein